MFLHLLFLVLCLGCYLLVVFIGFHGLFCFFLIFSFVMSGLIWLVLLYCFVWSRYCSVHNISTFQLLVFPKSELYGIRNTYDIANM
jgi:hypothetical protein